MTLIELLIIAVGLSMDAFAVALCLGLTAKKTTPMRALTVGLYFGFFQGFMPFLGYLGGSYFADYITNYDHWVAFALLGAIGGKMVWESFSKDEQVEEIPLTPRKMLPLAIATSIDALAVGITFAFLHVDIVPAVLSIGVITLVLSAAGFLLGGRAGMKFKSRAELAGGLVLIGIGVKILIEHLFFN